MPYKKINPWNKIGEKNAVKKSMCEISHTHFTLCNKLIAILFASAHFYQPDKMNYNQ